jgi:hypothetical protein
LAPLLFCRGFVCNGWAIQFAFNFGVGRDAGVEGKL